MEKKELRAQIKALKKQHTKEQLLEQSERILAKLEQHPDFIKAERVMLYSALPDEVQTQAFLEKWHLQKTIILPTVVGDDIVPVEYGKDTAFAVGDFNTLSASGKRQDATAMTMSRMNSRGIISFEAFSMPFSTPRTMT